MKPVIFGLSGPDLTADEAAFFRDADPAGYILFKRNCVDRAQLRRLTDALRTLHGRDDLAILIDQEGGRVARMQPPEWPAFPAPGVFDPLYDVAPISALEAVRVAVGEGVRVLTFSFHSPSLVAGHTPYVRDARDLAAFWGWWDKVLAELHRLGVVPTGLDALIAAADATRA